MRLQGKKSKCARNELGKKMLVLKLFARKKLKSKSKPDLNKLTGNNRLERKKQSKKQLVTSKQ